MLPLVQLGSVISSAQTVIAQNVHSPTGMIPSQLAAKVSQQLERKVTAARVNKALHDLKLQDWAKPGVNRERKLTDEGKKYGVALLTTLAEGKLDGMKMAIAFLGQPLAASRLIRGSLTGLKILEELTINLFSSKMIRNSK
jgi:hypothetical protein